MSEEICETRRIRTPSFFFSFLQVFFFRIKGKKKEGWKDAEIKQNKKGSKENKHITHATKRGITNFHQ